MTRADTWSNWSGNLTCRPRHLAEPHSEEEVQERVRDAARSGLSVRCAGSGHSFSPLCLTDGLLLSLDGLRGVIDTDREACTATVWAGTKLHELGAPLRQAGLAMENMGDIDRQSIAGAISTGTHGTGETLRSISNQVEALTLATADGELLEISLDSDPAAFRAAQVSLGALGVVTRVRLRLLPTYRLHERTWTATADDCLAQLDELIAANRHFEFFWTSQRDRCFMKALNPTAAEPDEMPDSKGEYVDHSDVVFPTERTVKFDEIEFALPAESGVECFGELRRLMRTRYPDVEWPLEYRTLAADEPFLSPAHGRETVTISAHQSAELPKDDFFADVEAIFRNHRGRPHWGKMHTHTADELEALYPRWGDFLAVRSRLDPAGTFLNAYLQELFGITESRE